VSARADLIDLGQGSMQRPQYFSAHRGKKNRERALHARTKVFLALVVAVLVGSLGLLAVDPIPVAPHNDDILLIYVGADDCAPCRKWQREDAAGFRASAEFTRILYREVKSPTLFAVLQDEYWPEDLRGYRDRLEPGAGVPLWLVVSNNRIVEQRFGASQWQASILPKIKSLLR
jgi:hypothetical protein